MTLCWWDIGEQTDLIVFGCEKALAGGEVRTRCVVLRVAALGSRKPVYVRAAPRRVLATLFGYPVFGL